MSMREAMEQIRALSTGWKCGNEGVHLLRINDLAEEALAQQQLSNIVDSVCESIVNAPDEEILEDARLNGLDPAENADKLRTMFHKTLAEFQGGVNVR